MEWDKVGEDGRRRVVVVWCKKWFECRLVGGEESVQLAFC